MKDESVMENWTLNLPVPVEFGPGALRKITGRLAGYAKALVVTGRRAMKEAGVTDRLRNLLSGAGVENELYDCVSPDPNYEEIEEAADRARRFGAQVIIGCGGGSALDAAKAVAVAATHPGPIMDYRGGTKTITAATLPILAVSATSGTGSHVGRVAVLSDRRQKIKRAFFSDYMYPKAAFCDPEILRTMPRDVTAATGFDAFAHALEGFLSSQENPMGNLCAQEAIRVIHETLPRVLEHGDDLDLRGRMAWGDTLAGISLATNTVVIPHVIGMVLGGRYGATHGPGIASVTVACLKHSRPGAVDKLAAVARLLGCRETGGPEQLADEAILAVEEFLRAIGLTRTPADYGMKESDIDDIAREVRTVFAARVEADPVPTDAAGIAAILRSTLH
jgi:alcohol dehydrogenase class IV